MLQPFKRITVVMKERTNTGITKEIKQPVVGFGLNGDMRYTPITLDDTGLGEPLSDSNKTSKAIVGILTESFNKPMAQTQVMVSGIVNMKAANSIKAGSKVYWDVTNKRVYTTTTDGLYVGVALTTSTADNDIIDVLFSGGRG